jgi:hypothetical protein
MTTHIRIYSILLISSLFPSCYFPNKPIQYTGSIHDVSSLPTAEAKAYNSTITSLATSTFSFGNKKRINAGAIRPITDNIKEEYIEYRSISQDLDGSSKWLLKWKHKKHGSGERVILYKGKPIYAINKSDFKFGLFPTETKKANKSQ